MHKIKATAVRDAIKLTHCCMYQYSPHRNAPVQSAMLLRAELQLCYVCGSLWGESKS